VARSSTRGRQGPYTIAQAATELEVHESTVRRLIRRGALRAQKGRGRGGTRWLLSPQALEGYQERRHETARARTTAHMMARWQLGADLPADRATVAVLKTCVYGPVGAPLHRARLSVGFDEWWRFVVRRPSSPMEAAAIRDELRRRCGLSDEATVCLRVQFDLDPEDLARVLREVVRSVPHPSGLLASPQDLQTQAFSDLLLRLPALARVDGADPRPYLRAMVRNGYRTLLRARARVTRELRDLSMMTSRSID
jgi:excisionase family DNA binding protein